MGLPVRRFVCASNSNDVLTDFIHTGVYDRRRNFYTTISPSMDILISSNLERMLYYLCGEDAAEVRRCMDALRTDGVYEISDGAKQALSGLFAGGFCDDAKTKSAILREFERSGYVCDPHTAVAVQVYGDYAAKGTDDVPALIASTASPYKFAASVLSALSETGRRTSFCSWTGLRRSPVCPARRSCATFSQNRSAFPTPVPRTACCSPCMRFCIYELTVQNRVQAHSMLCACGSEVFMTAV